MPSLGFLLIFVGIPLLTVLWWVRLELHGWPRQRGRLVLWAYRLFTLATLVALGWTFIDRHLLYQHRGGLAVPPPTALQYLGLLWAVMITPFVIMPLLVSDALISIIRRLRTTPPATPPAISTPDPRQAPLSRRGLFRFATAHALLPPTATAGLAAFGRRQSQRFRVSRYAIPIPDLPPPLHGLTLAHLSDSHFGKITRGPIIDRIVEQTNALRPDLICFTGDLIDHHLEDLDTAIDFLHRLKPKHALALVEGNHDLLHGRDAFAQPLRQAGLNLLINQALQLDIHGHPIDLLGLSWNYSHKTWRDLGDLQGTIRPGAFPILLAHHPRIFDHAHKYNIPLTLAGHTHGGQIMLHREFGPGPLFFKYWSGLYQQNNTTLHVSNGVGNWFPLRLNAPAEVSLLTLQPAPPAPPA